MRLRCAATSIRRRKAAEVFERAGTFFNEPDVLAARRVVWRLYRGNQELAKVGCEAIDELIAELDCAKFHGLQEELWELLRMTERQIRQLRGREPKRKKRLGKRRLTAESARARAEHLQVMDERRQYLEERRSVIQQLGDALAWGALRSSPRLIVPLHSTSRSHHLPDDERGHVGPLSVLRKAAESGRFLVVNADLTRCLGIGDLIVVRADGRWVWPLVYEVKTRAAGPDHVAIWLMGADVNLPIDRELQDDFKLSFGYATQEPPDLRDREQRQLDEIRAGARLQRELIADTTRMIGVKGHRHWDVVTRVLARAERDGFAYDLAEEGLVYAAARNHAGDGHIDVRTALLDRLVNEGIADPENGFRAVSSWDFQRESELSALAPPIPSWKIPREHRASLLLGDIFFVCAYHERIWQRAFGAYGLSCVESEKGGWRVGRGERHINIDPLEMQRMKFGVAFGAFSPREEARNVANVFQALSLAE